jgi:SecD/SecF fusion protein
MQNKGAIILFTILLAIASLYQLSFSYFTSNVEKVAKAHAQDQLDSILIVNPDIRLSERDSMFSYFENKFLKDHANEKVYPGLGFTYQECKEKGINLGLDLEGGMSVVLEVSIPELVQNLSGNSKNSSFREAMSEARAMQKESKDDFITLFDKAWEKSNPDLPMWKIFHNRDNKEKFPQNISNDQVIDILRVEAQVAIDNTEKILRTRIDKFGVAQPTIQKQEYTGRILIELPGVKDKDRIRKQLKSTANLEFWTTYENEEILPVRQQVNEALAKKYNLDAVSDSATTDAVEDLLLAEEGEDELILEAAEDSLLDDIANNLDTANADLEDADDLTALLEDTSDLETGITDAEKEEYRKSNPLFSVFQAAVYQDQNSGTLKYIPGAIVGSALVSDTALVNNMLKEDVSKAILPPSLQLLWGAKSRISGDADILDLYAIRVDDRDGKPALDGSVIIDARQDFDMTNRIEVTMQMNSEGAKIWKDLTANNIGKAIAIVLDDYVYSAPNVISEIPSGRSSISMGSGDRTEQLGEAKDLATLLKAGALPARANIVEESIVGPSLGQENIDDGMISFAIALAIILLYMIFYYRGAGLVSDLALLANLFFLMGALASLQAALTLPGIAGIILTIGMAIDANVLIYERIKEELSAGRSMKQAIKEGYNKAYSAIIDANITTLLTAIILLVFGSGPIKGFATTLIIGIFTSLFSAILITRLIFDNRLAKGKSISFGSKLTAKWFTNPNIQFLTKRKIAYIFSSIIIIMGVISIATKGLNYGVDFTGGRTYVVKFNEKVDIEAVRADLGQVFVDKSGNSIPPEVKQFGGTNQVKITTKYLINDESDNVDELVEAKLNQGLDMIGDDFSIQESRKVDPTITNDFKYESVMAILLSLIVIFLYILMRFRKWQYGLSAIIAVFHDVLIVLSLYSLLYGVLPFDLEIDMAFIAAILTVLGYSINDTVVVFDRIREFLGLHKRKPTNEIVNDALNSTLSRTINTSLSTFVVLLSIFIFGGDSIRGFVFALMIGVVVGTYSSLFVATPLLVDFSKNLKSTVKE